MFGALKKAVLFGTGLAMMTTEKMKEFADEMVKKGEMSEQEARQALKEWTEKSKQTRKEMEAKIDEMVGKAMVKMNIPTRSEVDELKARLARLEKARRAEKEQEKKAAE